MLSEWLASLQTKTIQSEKYLALLNRHHHKLRRQLCRIKVVECVTSLPDAWPRLSCSCEGRFDDNAGVHMF